MSVKETQFKVGQIPWNKGKKLFKNQRGGMKQLDFDIKLAKKLYTSGLSFIQISKIVGVSRNTLERRFDSLGFNRRTRKEAIHLFQKTDSYKSKISKLHKDKNKNLIWKRNRMKKIRIAQNHKKTKPEIIAEKILAPLGFNFVGDGKFFIEAFNPDFLHEDRNLIIEVYGDYWHRLPKQMLVDKRRIRAYKSAGFKTLILWEDEIKTAKNLADKIKEFIS